MTVKSFKERFVSRIQKSTPETCWIWGGFIGKLGYGQCRHQGKSLLAHRVSYSLFVGQIPSGMQVDHVCHCRACVNPAHLRLATHTENMHNRKMHCTNTSGFKGVS